VASDAQRGQSRLLNEWTECQCRFSYRNGVARRGDALLSGVVVTGTLILMAEYQRWKAP